MVVGLKQYCGGFAVMLLFGGVVQLCRRIGTVAVVVVVLLM